MSTVPLHPVYTYHAREVEDLLDHVNKIWDGLRETGLTSCKEYPMLCRLRCKCQDLLLKLETEDSEILLMNDVDLAWMKKIVGFVKEHHGNRAAL